MYCGYMRHPMVESKKAADEFIETYFNRRGKRLSLRPAPRASFSGVRSVPSARNSMVETTSHVSIPPPTHTIDVFTT